MDYIIKPEDWDYNDAPDGRYTDEDLGFCVDVLHETDALGNECVCFAGYSTTFYDSSAVYYYDAVTDGYPRARLEKLPAAQVLDSDGRVRVEVTLPGNFGEVMEFFQEEDARLFSEAYEFAQFAQDNGIDVTGQALRDNVCSWMCDHSTAAGFSGWAVDELATYASEYFIYNGRVCL